MLFRRPKFLQSPVPASGDMSDPGTVEAGETTHDVVVKPDSSKSDNTYQGQSTTRVALLLTSVLMSMFLVALDRTIISTVSNLC